MVDMKLSAEAQKSYPEIAVADKPRYPYGLCISLDKDALDKLGIKDLPDIGQEFMLKAKVEVSGYSESESAGGHVYKSLSLQITEMDLGKKKSSSDDTAKKLYGEK